MRNKSGIEAVAFDAGGILFDDTKHREGFKEYVKRQTGDRGILGENDMIFKRYKNRSQTEKDYSRQQAYQDCLGEIGREDLYEGWMGIFSKDLEEKLILMPHVNEVLRGLKEREIIRGIVTDNFSSGESFIKRLYEVGMDPVDYIVSSKDCGFKKPDYRIFKHMENVTGLRKEGHLFVAHDLDEIKGAVDLGYRTAAIYWDKKEEEAISRCATYMIRDFRDILNIVDGRI